MNDNIFIVIPAYEDFDLPRTVEEAIQNAYDPNRLKFVIGLQYKNTPIDFFVDKYKSDNRFSFISYDVDTRPGVVKIRHELTQLHTDEKYLLLIDSHMKFVKYWDQVLINRYLDMQREFGMDVVWSRPMSDEPTLSVLTGEIDNVILWEAAIDAKHLVSNHSGIIRPNQTIGRWDGKPFSKSAWLTSQFAFMEARWIKEVGFDPNIQQYCEEQLSTIKTYIAGWELVYDAILYPIGHNVSKTNLSLYGKEVANYHDKQFGNIDSEETKLEVAKFLLTGYSDKIEVRQRKRDIEEFYNSINASDLVEALKLYYNIDS
jgi:hypothetical protein